ncbi:Cysteine protease, C1A family [Solimonas aquatica]|uniref:Cysteine protease, C1A family n=1 Tax=Solimonas aquatica TaxID=489703 RepID=A0A1H9KJR4_9GAMM|nr:C1 family peptidase [Solimonas aquatica]SEQ99342.1 Cysteine protease, C1A family [Solimonas aquatica]
MPALRKASQHRVPWYGWQPDLPDHRDHPYAAVHGRRRRLPRQVDLRAHCPPVDNQGSLGSCTAHALSSALEFLELRAGQRLVNLSRLFVYYNERVIEHSVERDAGASLRNGIKTLVRQGVCEEALWPYRIREFQVRPPPPTYRQATRHCIRSYQRLETLEEMRDCLAEGYPFVFGFSIYESFESARVARSGVLEMPARHEAQLGGHAVMAVGYDDRARRFLVRNSWARDWGQQGYFTMPYAYLENRNLSDDFWTVRR